MQRDPLRYVAANAVLVGRGLGLDLFVLRSLQWRVVDTSVLYPNPNGNKQSLAGWPLKRQNQHTHGHDSVEDARTAVDLALYKIHCDMQAVQSE